MPEERKLVTVLFADIVGSTALGHDNDPEVVRGVLSTYFERVREIVEAHGGTVEKFIGDAAMAVFGVPRVHDDDAERAVRAALAIQAAIPALNAEAALTLEARIGVNSGEVVAAVDDRDQALVTGDVVNVAARLQQQADSGQVLVGPLTAQLTREAIEYEEAVSAEVRGRPGSVTVSRAVRARSQTPDQARGLPGMRARLVGRQRELRLLVDTFERARDDQRPQLLTIVGSAGVGKSRLVGEFLARISGAEQVRVDGVVSSFSGDLVKIEASGPDAAPLTVLRGRCLPYGTGITYWPLMELLQADLGITTADARDDVVARLDARLAEVQPEARAQPGMRARLGVLLGIDEASTALPDVPAPRRTTELGLGLGTYLEALAGHGPVVVVVDDLQWADDAVLEIVRSLRQHVVDVPLLVACIARPDLLEREPSWGAGVTNSTTIVLEPLNTDETRTLIARLLDIDDLPESLRTQVIARSEGNPLFCEEFVRMLIEEGRLVHEAGRWRAADPDMHLVRVPESIQALIAARLDALSPSEKALLHAASIIGEEFDLAQVADLVGGGDHGETVDSLVRRGIVAPNRRAGPGAHRFRHILIRDVAYATLPKAERARLHEAFGRLLEADAVAGGRRDELVEILAYHAERSLTLSIELRMPAPVLRERARRALDLSFESADRAVTREDVRSAASFQETVTAAASLLAGELEPVERARLRLLEGEVALLRPDYPAARVALLDAAGDAEAAGAHVLAGTAWRKYAHVLVQSMQDDEIPVVAAAIDAARREYGVAGDIRGRLATDAVALEADFSAGRLSAMIDAGLRLADEALAIGDRPRAAATWARLISAAAWAGLGDLADDLATRALALADELSLSSTRRWARFFRARLAWMRADFAAAAAECRALAREADDAADGTMQITANRLLAESLYEDGRLDEADAAFEQALAHCLETGDRWSLTELLAGRALIRVDRGDLAEARVFLDESLATLRPTDIAAVSVFHDARAGLRDAEGRYAEAEADFGRAIDAGRASEYWWWTMPAVRLAEFLVRRGRIPEAGSLIADVDATMRRAGYGIRRGRIDAVMRQVAGQPA